MSGLQRVYAPKVTVPNGLVAYWPLDIRSLTPTLALDKSVGGNNYGTQTSTTLANGGLSFNGSTAFVASQNNSGVAGDFTMTFSSWINPASTAIGATILFAGTSGSFNGFAAFMSSNGAGSMAAEFFGGHGMRTAAGVVLANQWSHVLVGKKAGAVSAANTFVYVNGVAQAFAVTTTGTPNLVNSPFQIGRYLNPGTSEPWNGLQRESRVYNRVPDPWEVIAIYKAGMQGRP